MAYEEKVVAISLDADASLGIYTGVPGQPGSAVPNSGRQYRFVKGTGEHQVGLAVGTSDDVVGVMTNKPQTPGAAATIVIGGVIQITAGGALPAWTRVGPDTQGRAIANANGRWLTVLTAAGIGELTSIVRV